MILKKVLLISLIGLTAQVSTAQVTANTNREHLLMDFGWRFAFGHPYDTKKDFSNGTSYFSYFAKTGYGDGAAAPAFDDRTWRKVNLPHDWAVEQGFDAKASFSHGFKAIGRNFPEASVGWYRKSFKIPATDLGRRIHIAFDGVFRNSIVWINGHYLGTQPSGYLGFDYDITEYLNYGAENIIAVRVDATMEEGWFYEGAGIYRHVWLNKLDDVHAIPDGISVTTKVKSTAATVSTRATLTNEGKLTKAFTLTQQVVDADGKTLASARLDNLILRPFEEREFAAAITVDNPKLWSIETPYLHKLITTVQQGDQVIDSYVTNFGIRTIRFDANEGFFLNGQHVKIKGTNNHQDHAGVGSAMPDGLIDFRIKALKQIGSNAYRCSHNPPTPELLDACDRLGMLVIDENRLMGVTNTELGDLKRMIQRDRNHPSIISWSIGNEEWGIENTITGARIASTMQAFAKSIDSTRYITAAFSGGVGSGISNVMELIGYNYVSNKNTDEHHKNHPAQYSWGTEEGSTVASRGIYDNDAASHHRAAYDERQNASSLSIEEGWKHYDQRSYLAGMFIWTGFDYRGEPTPYGWPSTGSYFGMMDQCGFPKDDVYYLKAWWTNQPVIHILPHWDWPGKQGQDIAVWVYSNATEVELFLNDKSQGKKPMEKDGHLTWSVKYQPGTLRAVGYQNGKATMLDVVKTTGQPANLQLNTDGKSIGANQEDIAVISVELKDKNGLHIPTATTPVDFSISGPGKIIGVGNGDPASIEPDQYLETISTLPIVKLKEKMVEGIDNRPETAADVDDNNWQRAFTDNRTEKFAQTHKAVVYRSSFKLTPDDLNAEITLFYNSIGRQQSIYINGKQIAVNIAQSKNGDAFKLDKTLLKAGDNTISIAATPLFKKQSWESVNTNPGSIQLIKPAGQWKRKLFSGWAQVIVQSTGQAGTITLKATAAGLKPSTLTIEAINVKPRPNAD